MTESTPSVVIMEKTNPIIIGLISLDKATQNAPDIVGDRQNYGTEHVMTFMDGLLSIITFGIYTPTTTRYYIPYDEK